MTLLKLQIYMEHLNIGSVSGETTPYKEVKLFSGATVTRGTASQDEPVGVCRIRA